MKKIFSLLLVLSVCASGFADDKKTAERKVLCTIVCSPCEDVPNTLIPGEATAEQIKKAQEEMSKACED